MIKTLVITLTALCLFGCGLKGPLYMPEPVENDKQEVESP